MLQKILLGLVAIVAAFLGFAATRPNTFHVERSVPVAATPDAVLNVMGDFHRFPEWSPWQKLDPNMKTTFEGDAGTVGSSYAWTGNSKVGEGKMTITEVQPDHITMRLEFIKPWQATNTTTYTVAPDGANTKVTWSMDGKNNFMFKVMGIFMNMDKAVGKDFEEGLAALKPVVEAAAKTAAARSVPPSTSTQ